MLRAICGARHAKGSVTRLPTLGQDRYGSYDVLVAGGGMAGITAALAAARARLAAGDKDLADAVESLRRAHRWGIGPILFLPSAVRRCAV